MCLRAGDNVATRNPRSSAETWHASISRQQLDPPNGEVSLLPIVAAGIRCHFGLTITCFPRKGLLGTAIPNNVAGVGELRQENGLVNFRSDIHSIKSSCYRKLLLKNEVALMQDDRKKQIKHESVNMINPRPPRDCHPTPPSLDSCIQWSIDSGIVWLEIYQPTCIPAGSLGHLLLSTLSERSN